MACSELDVKQALRRLGGAYNPPRDTTAMLDAWLFVVKDLGPDELAGAVDDYLRSDAAYFPKPGKIRQNVLDHRRSHQVVSRPAAEDWNQREEGPCPVCGATMRALTPAEQGVTHVYDVRADRHLPIDILPTQPPKRYGVLHDLAKHEAAKTPAIGYAR